MKFKYSIIVLVLILALLWFTGAFAAVLPPQAADSDAITENERQSVVVGMVMGIDLAGAHQGLPPLTPDEWTHFAQIFEKVTENCTTIRCVTDHVMKLRRNVEKLNNGPSGRRPLLPQVEKQLM